MTGPDAVGRAVGRFLPAGENTVECNVRGITLTASYATGPRELVERAQRRAA